jgi:hypothetical protein
MGLFELEGRVKKLESRWNKLCCYLRACLGISSTTGDPDLVLNQQGEWVNNGGGGGGSYYLYSENYDSATFYPSTVTGLNAVSIGVANTASGDYSTAIGGGNTASGEVSISIGTGNIASGKSSMATGYETTAKSYVETSLGFQNTDYTPISDIAFEPTDRLIVVGNGKADAFTILKNGKTAIGIDNFETTTSLSKLQVNGVVSTSISTINSNTALDSTNITSVILVDHKSYSVNIILPDSSEMIFNGMTGRITIKSISSYNVLNLVTILPFGGELIDNASSFVFTTDYESIELVTDGKDWWIIK